MNTQLSIFININMYVRNFDRTCNQIKRSLLLLIMFSHKNDVLPDNDNYSNYFEIAKLTFFFIFTYILFSQSFVHFRIFSSFHISFSFFFLSTNTSQVFSASVKDFRRGMFNNANMKTH